MSDAANSVAEATLTLDLAHKKNVVLSFKAKSLGNEPNPPPANNFSNTRNYDGVAVSVDGGTTWRAVQSLAGVGTDWESFNITLDSSVAWLGSFSAGFRIRFSEYDNARVPIDGIAIDDVAVTGDDDLSAVLELPSSVREGSGPYIGYVLLSFSQPQAVTVALATSPTGQVLLPASVVVPAGQSYASFEFTVADDALVNLTRIITVTPLGPAGFTGVPSSIVVLDDEALPTATLTLPAQLKEGELPGGNAFISLKFPATAPIVFDITTSPAGEISVPSTVTVPAGATLAGFTAQALNDTRLDGDILVTVTATAPLLAPAVAQTTAVDDEIPALSLVLPATLTEGAAGTATINMSGALPAALTVNLTSSLTAALTVPTTIMIPAGQTTATFPLTTVDDGLINFARSATISASGTGVSSTSASLSVLDDETPPVLTLTLPATVTEGLYPAWNATVSLSTAAAAPLTVVFTTNPGTELSLPFSLIIPAGQTQVAFTVQAANDTRIDGDVLVSVSATPSSASGVAPATASITTIDNETRVLTLALPATILEGGTGSGTVTMSGTLTTPLVVSLTSSKVSALTLPATVTIPAGGTQVSFIATAPDNAATDGSRPVNGTVAAATFTGASAAVVVRDNELVRYSFSGLANIVNVSKPQTITVGGADVEGNIIPGVLGTVNLSLVRPDGTTQPLTPPTAVLSGSAGWTGSVTLPAVTVGPLKLRATGTGGITGDSSFFDPLNVLSLTTADLLWDGVRKRIFASVPATAGGAYANQVVAIDPATLQITGSVTTGQDPGQIVMTSGGEYLYVALKANGTVDRIERSPTAGTFIGYNNYTSGFGLTRLLIASDGVTITQTNSSVISGYYVEIRSSGSLLASSSGLIVDAASLTLKSNLGTTGRPCLDTPYQRAYIVNGASLRAFDTTTGSATGSLTLPTTLTGDWALNSLRWGLDGFAILGPDKIYLARWSAAIPAALDSNNDGTSDAWAAAYFSTFTLDPAADTDRDGIADSLEYLFGTSPLTGNRSPIAFSTTKAAGRTILHLTFPRRADLAPGSYGFLVGTDLATWQPVASLTETIISTQIIGGVKIDTIDAAVPSPSEECGYLRLKWTHP